MVPLESFTHLTICYHQQIVGKLKVKQTLTGGILERRRGVLFPSKRKGLPTVLFSKKGIQSLLKTVGRYSSIESEWKSVHL